MTTCFNFNDQCQDKHHILAAVTQPRVRPTLQQIESQQDEEYGSGGNLDPPSIKEREEDDSDDALPGQ